MIQKVVTGFSKGMNRDTAFTKYDPENYFEANNLRIVIDEEGKTGTLNNIKGNSLNFSVTDTSIDGIVGYCFIQNGLVLFGSGTGIFNIYYVEDINDILESSTVYDISTPTVSFDSEELEFKTAVGRYESEDIIKVYFTGILSGDDYPSLFVVNLASPPIYSPLYFKYCKVVPEFKISAVENIVETSGGIKTGTVQYAYQLYNPNGQESMFVPASKPLTVTTSSSTAQIKDYVGNNSNLPSSKGFNFDITIDSVPFSRLRIVRLYYQTIDTLPEVIIIYEGIVASGDTVNVTDAGQSLGSYTMEEFRFISNIIYPKYMDEKNNYLFLANITEDVFDVDYDARAFRYKVNSPNTYVTNPDTLEETYDVVNPYNDLSNDGDATKRYKYQISSGTRGGTGKNVSYKFITQNILLDDLSNETLVTGDAENSYCNPLTQVGYQRDEIYRFGIVWFDYYGRSSFVKWIDDIRFPNVSEYILTTESVIDGKLYASVLGIQFSVNNPPTGAYAYQIVRCKRDESNRTVVDCGLCGHTEAIAKATRCFKDNFNDPLYPRFMNAADYASSGSGLDTNGKNLVEYITPEYNYNKRNLSANLLYTWKACNSLSDVDFNYVILDPSGDNVFVTKKIREYNTTFANRLAIKETNTFALSQTSVVPIDTIDGVKIRHEVAVVYATSSVGLGSRGSTLVVVLNEGFNPTNTTGPTYAYRRNNNSPYGGQSYGARQSCTYYPCSDIVVLADFSTSYNTVWGGDTYISMFQHNRAIMIQDVGGSPIDLGQVIFFPVETTVNMNLQSNTSFNSLHSGTTSYGYTPAFVAMQETPGVYAADNSGLIYYTQTYSLYSYNSVYSQQDMSKSYLMKPSDFTLIKTHTNMVTSSEKKTDGESIDSWSKFKFNNKISVNGKFGGITGLINFKNILMYTQPDAYGILSVEDREIQQSSNIGGYVLGTGGVLSRYDYINTEIGVKESIADGKVNLIATANALYMYDSDRRKLFRYTGEHEVLSDTLGFISYMQTLNNTYPDFNVGYNRKYSEVYFSNPYLNNTLVFSEITDTFTSFYDIYSNLWLNYKNNTWVVKGNTYTTYTDFYLQDSSTEYNTFFGVYYPSTLTFIVNPQSIIPVRFDTIQFNTNSNVAQQSFTTIKFDNSYQTSGNISLDYESVDEEVSNFRRRFRPWRFNTIFDTPDNNRFKDTYLKCTVSFTDPDTTNHATSLQIGDIITGFTQLPIK